jgi:hypothetical protein
MNDTSINMFTHPGHLHKTVKPKNKKNSNLVKITQKPKKNQKKNPKQKSKSEETTLRAIQNLKLFKTSGPKLKLNYNINNKVYPILMNAV